MSWIVALTELFSVYLTVWELDFEVKARYVYAEVWYKLLNHLFGETDDYLDFLLLSFTQFFH